MKAEFDTDSRVMLKESHHLNFVKAKSVVITFSNEQVLQVHESQDESIWEVWFIPPEPEQPVCIASSVNPPDRHYDE